MEEYLRLLFAAEPWRSSAACRGMGPAIFFPVRGQSTTPAKRICRACPVKAECRAAANANDETHGVWGEYAYQP